ncbi:MAG: site-specific DNA-methyltransferase, partial [Ignavibacteriaceae bacterium]|nr:site-specific DNA-methyltransferase [Ignavibacteriaceae bacterium]
MNILSAIESALAKENLEVIKRITGKVFSELEDDNKIIIYPLNGTDQSVRRDFLLKELKQILETKTIERTKYYLNRLRKSLSVQKEGKINEINLNRWKEYEDIITDSLWIFDKRDSSGAHKADYWGNFIPQIPNQFLKRFTKKGDWVLDPFIGSGTTLIECKRLGRNGIGIELNKKVAKAAKGRLAAEKNIFEIRTELFTGDSST